MHYRKHFLFGYTAMAWLLLSACDKENEQVQTAVYSLQPDSEGSASVQSAQVKQLLQENAKLREKLQRYEQGIQQLNNSEPTWRVENPEIATFSDNREWSSISILSDGKETTIDDPALLEFVSPLFAIQGPADYTNGPQSDIDPFSLELKDKSGRVYRLDMVNRESVEFPELAPGHWFRLSEEVSSLGKAWMKRPDYVPEESLASRMLNSGAMKASMQGETFYFTQSFRIRRIAVEFLQADKKPVSKPKAVEGYPSLEATFNLYGQEVMMRVFPKLIEIRDGENVEVGEETAKQMLGFLAAG